MESEILYALVLIAGLVLYSLFLFPFEMFLLWTIGGAAVLMIPYLPVLPKYKWMLELFLSICFSSILFSYNHSFLYLFFLGVSFWGIWKTFLFFDTFPLVSFLTTFCWGIPFILTGILMRIAPDYIIAMVALLSASGLACSYLRLSEKKVILGKEVASFMGFAWASIWVFFLAQGAVFQTLTFCGYYLFEVVFLFIFIVRYQIIQTFFGYLLTQSQLSSRAIKIIFIHLSMLSFWGAITLKIKGYPGSVLLFTLIILLDMYMRLNNLIHPVSSWREIFTDTKKTITESLGQLKQISFRKKAVRTSQKKETIPKKSVKKRKSKK